MKKLKGIVLATVLSALVFSGCKQSIIEDAVVAPSETNTTATVGTAQRTLKISATTEEGLIKFPESSNKAARTILPESFVDGDGNPQLTFYIGIKKKGEPISYEKIEFTKDPGDDTGCTGTVTKTGLELTTYDLKLYAVPKKDTLGNTIDEFTDDGLKETTIRNAAIFAGYASADMRYDTTAKFYLTSNNLDGNGKLDVTLKTTWTIPADYTITAGLYSIDTDECKYPTPAETITYTEGDVLNFANWVPSNSIKVGTYNLKVIFTQKTGENKSYVYSEKVVILANRTSKGTVIIPEIISYKPTKPKDLIALYKNPSNAEDTYYTVQFAWTDTSYCETGFEFELMQVVDTGFPVQPTTDTEWNSSIVAGNTASATNEKYLKVDKTTLPFYPHFVTGVDRDAASAAAATDNGNLNMNNDHFTIQLPLETRYVARIRAVNDEGQSAWTYCEFDQTTTDGITKGTELDDAPADKPCKVTTNQRSYDGSAYKPWDADVTTMNRYRIRYNLVGGAFKNASDGTTTNMPLTVVFESQHTNKTGTPAAADNKVSILKPNSKAVITGNPGAAAVKVSKNTYYTPAIQENVYLELKAGDAYWEKWTINSTSGTDYPTTAGTETETGYNIPNNYTGFKNLNLFAVYDVKTSEDLTGNINISDINKYVLANTDLMVDFKNGNTSKTKDLDGMAKGLADGAATWDKIENLLEFVEGAITSIEVTRTPEAGNKYYKMNLKIIACSTGQAIFDTDYTNDDSWKVTIDSNSYKIGKYLVVVTAYTNQIANVPYTQQFAFSIIGSNDL